MASVSSNSSSSSAAVSDAECTQVFLAIGSNVGDRDAALRETLKLLTAAIAGITCSAIFETAPWGDADQPPFLNAVLRGETQLGPLHLLHRCGEIERALGRVPTRRWGPRAIDIDLLSYGDIRLATSELVLPHPRLHERAFVLVPLAELAPEWRHPTRGGTAVQLRDALSDDELEGVKRWPARVEKSPVSPRSLPSTE